MFYYYLLIIISKLLMSSLAPLYTFYMDKLYGPCQIVDYCIHCYPHIYNVVICNMLFDRGNIAREEDVVNIIERPYRKK